MPKLKKYQQWLSIASEDQLRDFLKRLDASPASREKDELMTAFKTECNKRASAFNESLNGGEWI